MRPEGKSLRLDSYEARACMMDEWWLMFIIIRKVFLSIQSSRAHMGLNPGPRNPLGSVGPECPGRGRKLEFSIIEDSLDKRKILENNDDCIQNHFLIFIMASISVNASVWSSIPFFLASCLILEAKVSKRSTRKLSRILVSSVSYLTSISKE